MVQVQLTKAQIAENILKSYSTDSLQKNTVPIIDCDKFIEAVEKSETKVFLEKGIQKMILNIEKSDKDDFQKLAEDHLKPFRPIDVIVKGVDVSIRYYYEAVDKEGKFIENDINVQLGLIKKSE